MTFFKVLTSHPWERVTQTDSGPAFRAVDRREVEILDPFTLPSLQVHAGNFTKHKTKLWTPFMKQGEGQAALPCIPVTQETAEGTEQRLRERAPEQRAQLPPCQ